MTDAPITSRRDYEAERARVHDEWQAKRADYADFMIWLIDRDWALRAVERRFSNGYETYLSRLMAGERVREAA